MDPQFHQDPNAEKAIDDFSNTVGEDFIPDQRVPYNFADALEPRDEEFTPGYIATFAAAFAFSLGLAHLLQGTPGTEGLSSWPFFVMSVIGIAAAVGANFSPSPKQQFEPILTGLSAGAWLFLTFAATVAFGNTTASFVLGFLGLLAAAAFASPAFKGYWGVAVIGLATLASALANLLGPISELNLVLRGGIIGLLLQEFGTIFGGGGIADALEGQVGTRIYIVIPLIVVGLAALYFAHNRYLSSIIATVLLFILYSASPFSSNVNIVLLLVVVVLALVFAWRALEQLDGTLVWIICLTPALLVSAQLGTKTGPAIINLIFVSAVLGVLANLDSVLGFVESAMNKPDPEPLVNINDQQRANQGQAQFQQPNQQHRNITNAGTFEQNPTQHQGQPLGTQSAATAPTSFDQGSTLNPQEAMNQTKAARQLPDQSTHQAQTPNSAFGGTNGTIGNGMADNTIPAQDQTYIAGAMSAKDSTDLPANASQPTNETTHNEHVSTQAPQDTDYTQAQAPQDATQHPQSIAESPNAQDTTVQPTVEEIQRTIAANPKPEQARPEQRESIEMPAEPNWYPDPRGQFEYRWFDGTSWTQYVSIAGEQMTDENPI